MSIISEALSKTDRMIPIPDRFFGIEWLFFSSLVDVLFGFPFSGFIFGLFFESKYILAAIWNAAIFAYVGICVFKDFNFATLYRQLSKSSGGYQNFPKLDKTASFYSPNSSFENHRIFKIEKEDSNLFDSNQSLNFSRQRNISSDADHHSLNQSCPAFFENSSGVLPASVLISPKSPYSSHLFTQGHYKSMVFNGDISKSSTFDGDYSASKKLDWIFNSANLSSSDLSTGSYQSGFIVKDPVVNESQKEEQSENNVFNSHIINADGGIDSIFTSQHKKDRRWAGSKTKRDTLLMKIMEWHTDKNMSFDDMKKKNVQALVQELFANATVHRISFNNAIATDLAYFSSNFRSYLSKAILRPIVRAIDETNNILAQSNANFSIGNSPVEVLVMAMDQKPDLRLTKLPFLLPFLRIHQNQMLLVDTMRKFIHEPFVLHETLGGIKANSSFDKLSGYGATDSLFLSETEFIFYIFCAYLDYRMAPDSFAKQLEQPFSSVYILNEHEKPSIIQLKPKSFYIYSRGKKPTSSFDFVINGGLDIYVTPTSGTENMFAAFMLMIVYAKHFNNGRLGDININHTGLDLERLYRSR